MPFDCIESLWKFVRERKDLKICHAEFTQPILNTPLKKSLLWLSFVQIKKSLLAMNLATEKEIDTIIKDLYDIAHDDQYLGGSLRLIQLHLQKQ